MNTEIKEKLPQALLAYLLGCSREEMMQIGISKGIKKKEESNGVVFYSADDFPKIAKAVRELKKDEAHAFLDSVDPEEGSFELKLNSGSTIEFVKE